MHSGDEGDAFEGEEVPAFNTDFCFDQASYPLRPVDRRSSRSGFGLAIPQNSFQAIGFAFDDRLARQQPKALNRTPNRLPSCACEMCVILRHTKRLEGLLKDNRKPVSFRKVLGKALLDRWEWLYECRNNLAHDEAFSSLADLPGAPSLDLFEQRARIVTSGLEKALQELKNVRNSRGGNGKRLNAEMEIAETEEILKKQKRRPTREMQLTMEQRQLEEDEIVREKLSIGREMHHVAAMLEDLKDAGCVKSTGEEIIGDPYTVEVEGKTVAEWIQLAKDGQKAMKALFKREACGDSTSESSARCEVDD